MDYFTSDWNLNHNNIIKYQNRPFKTIDEMNRTLIDNCNRLVGKRDRLYFLGGFVFGPLNETRFLENAERYRRLINCENVFLIYGNHDRRGKKHFRFRSLFTFTGDYLEVATDNPRASLILNHYPIQNPFWNRIDEGSIHLHGHTYEGPPVGGKLYVRRMDVGVDGKANYERYTRIGENPPAKPEDYKVWSLKEILDFTLDGQL